MPTDLRLLIPFEVFPGPLPSGAPLADGGVLLSVEGDRAWVTDNIPGSWQHPARVPIHRLSLHLSPPPLDDVQWPARVDGAQVAAEMLARTLWGPKTGSIAWYVQNNILTLLMFTKDGGVIATAEWNLHKFNLDPNEPFFERLALAAVIRTRPWRTDAH